MQDESRNSKAKVMLIVGIILMFAAIIMKLSLQNDNTVGHALFFIMDIASLVLIFGSVKYNHGSITFNTHFPVDPNQSRTDNSIYVPHCPTCGSTNVEKISGASKVGKAVTFGVLAAGSISKTFHCKNCDYRW